MDLFRHTLIITNIENKSMLYAQATWRMCACWREYKLNTDLYSPRVGRGEFLAGFADCYYLSKKGGISDDL